MQIFNGDLRRGAAILTVQRPGDGFGRGDAQPLGLDAEDQLGIQLAQQQIGCHPGQFDHQVGLAHQRHFQQAVAHGGVDPPSHRQACHIAAVADQTHQKLTVGFAAVIFQMEGIGLEGGQPLGALHQISQPAQRVFDVLGRDIGHIGKGAEGRHIGKKPFAELTHVHADRHTVHRCLGGLKHGFGDAQRGRKIVGGAGRDISQRRSAFQMHQTVEGLIQRAVTARTHHQIIIGRFPCHQRRQLTRPLAGIDGGHPARPYKGIHNAQQLTADSGLARLGIDKKQ